MVIADNSHDTEGLHARRLGLGVEGRVATLIAEDDVWVNIGIEVRNAKCLYGVFERSLALATRVVGTSASGSVGAITIDVQVVIVACAAFEENGTGKIATV